MQRAPKQQGATSEWQAHVAGQRGRVGMQVTMGLTGPLPRWWTRRDREAAPLNSASVVAWNSWGLEVQSGSGVRTCFCRQQHAVRSCSSPSILQQPVWHLSNDGQVGFGLNLLAPLFENLFADHLSPYDSVSDACICQALTACPPCSSLFQARLSSSFGRPLAPWSGPWVCLASQGCCAQQRSFGQSCSMLMGNVLLSW